MTCSSIRRVRCLSVVTVAIAAIAIITMANPASAVIVRNQLTNNTAPTGDQGFSYVGRTAGTNSGVYLGYVNGFNWLLTVNHGTIGTTFNIGTHTFNIDTPSGVALGNGELKLYKLDGGNQSMPALEIRSASITSNTDVTMVGNGRVANGEQMDLDGVGGGTQGYKWTDTITRPKLWGTNKVYQVGPTSGGTQVFTTRFDDIGSVASLPNEATFADRDSGSGVFIQNGGVWELAGIAFSILQNNGVADATRGTKEGTVYPNAANGDLSYMIDLTWYRDDIINAMVPEPATMTLLAIGGVGLLRRR